MSAISPLSAHELVRDLGALVPARELPAEARVSLNGFRIGFASSFLAALRAPVRAFGRARARRHVERTLRGMSDHLLSDLGIERGGISDLASQMSSRAARREGLKA